ncbi:beta strand repeat-containing protein [Qipengyuania huizhouensis]|uniref:beta strand repeat-containing protein n=1 Tax=Qipengyuania huizhouensis TaxID=2867245 RepID=UPI001C86AAFB|nr:DUF5801 repeats-in-toxin domain-containing protein [Qipengyuania huizhouensis]MBX7460162.1 tandem-95 repeat protein [Qipengyuania huizhouensis]
MDSFETRNEFADAQGSDNASESQATDIQGNSAQAMNLRNADIVLRPDADGVVVLPEGASLDNMTAQGRDLVIVLEDGTRIVIPEGAIIVPQIVIDGVTVPAANLAALLTGNEPQPAAGDPQSSGGNFEVDPGNIQAAYALGDLLPYTQLQFPQPEEREIIPALAERDPDIVIETPDNPVGVVNAIATVDEDGLPARTVDGAPEPEGTRSETNSETASGTIVFNAPDGVGSVLINGVAITSVGQTFQGETGTLTITSIDFANGRIGFSFTLEDNMVGGEIDGSFMMSVIDADGDRADANLQIRIIDDAPIAADDANSVAAGTFGPIAGSVLVNDESGADGYAAGGAVTGFANDGGSAEPGDTLVGTYGELTLNADGSYSYTRYFNTPGGVSEEFTYTITDADGSTSTATLTIDIGDANDAITNVPDGEDATVVDEDELPPTTGTRDDEPAGSDFDGDDETASGTITFTSPDGVGSVTIGGTVVDPENLPQVVVADDTGTLTVIDYTYDPETGEGTITYEYELTDNTGDPEGTTVDFPIVVIDLDGDVAEDDLVITIVDDVPEAFDDTGAQGEENAPITVDALDNDITGADGVDLATGVAVVDGTLSGDGSVSYNGDGTFTYTPGAGEEGTVTFDYTITDGDGDTSTATVTITLQPDSAPEIAVEGQDTVFEEALDARGDEPAGSNAASDGEFASGSIAIATGGDSIDSLVVNGVDVTDGGTVTTERGVLTVSVTDGAYSYSYELTDNTLVDPDSDSFTLVVTDSDGDTAQTTLVVSIVDDNPSAADDANAISAGEYGPVGGNVLANDVEGADGALVTSYTGANGTGSAGDTIQGEYGTLTIAADGSYSYTRNPGTEGGVSDSFTYTITDGDGDTATANLVIAIADSPVVIDLPVAGGDGTLVDEAGLPAGSDAASDSEFTSGAFTYDAPDGPATVTIGGQTVTAVGQTINGSFGTLTITSIAEGSIGYTYELTTKTDGDDTFDSFEVIVTDQDGDVASGDLDIAIIDDVPTAVADTDSVTEDGPLTADGNVITDAEANGDNGGDTTGADGASVSDVSFGGSPGTVGGATAGSYGSLVLNADGSYTYTLDNTNEFVQGLDSTESLTEVFTYTLTDGDGDTSVTTLTVTINGDDDIVTINGLDLETPELTVDEDDLADGSSPDAAALTPSGDFTVDSPDGLDTLTVGGVQVWGGGESYPISIPGVYGTVNVTGVTVTTDANGDVVAATVSYEYELSDNTLDHMADGEDQLVDSLEVVATDSDGSEDTALLDIAVIDDVPTANDDSANQGAENAPIVIDALANDVFGADGVLTADGVSVVVSSQGTQGTATYDPATGLFTYTPAPGAGSNGQLTDSFTYTITDQDGDSSTATVTVNLQPDSEPSGGTVAAAVDDDGLPGGNPDSTTGDLDANAGDDPADTSEASFTGTLTFDVGNDGPATITFDAGLHGSSVMLGSEMVTYSVSGNTLTASSDRGDIFTVEITDAATGDYTVTLLQNVLHTAGNDENDALASIGFTVTDSEGETADATLDITFDDDAPTATDNTNSVMEGATVTGNILTDDDGFGVDANGADGTLTILAVSGTGGSDNGAPFVVTGTYGELTVNADGSYSYKSFANATNADVTDSFTYQIVDADGDIAEATLDIDIANVAGTVEDNEAIVYEAGLPTGSDAPSDSEIDADGQITVTNATGTFTYVLTDPAGGSYGTLTLDSVTGEYTYTLNTNVDGDSIMPDQGGDNGANTVTGQESFGYEVYDEFNNLIGSGTINVDIVDDVPTATDQTVIDVAEDAADISGNVMTDGTPDTEGADGATVTAITVGAQTVAVPQDGSDATLMTANGTYTIDMDGNWTFDPNPGLDQSLGPIDADFSYTLTDGDGDTDTATQPIRILDGNGPNDPEAVSLTVDDQNLADGSTPAGPDSDSDTISFVPGSDPFDSIVFGDTSGLDGGLTWTRVDDFTITGSDGGRLVVTLTLNVVGDDATVTATLNDNYLGHSSQGDELDALGSVDVIATDIDGDTATGSVAVNVSDDVPTLAADLPTADSLTVDDDDFSTDATADFSTLFVPDYNADGPGDVSDYTLGFSDTATGLIDTLTNTDVTLVEVNGTIEGQNGNGDTVFVISVDANGTVTFDQQRAVVHGDTGDHNDSEPVPAWAADLITLTATVTDGDGDTAQATANIGGAFQILDDGPSVSASLSAGAMVVLDETDLTAAAGAIDLGATYTQGNDADVTGSPTLVGASSGVNVLDVTADFGNDQDVNGGGLSYSLVVGNGGVSGLSTTDGTAITLVAVSDTVVVGVVDGTTTAAFAVSIDVDTGEISVEQYLSVQHDDPSDPDEELTPETLATGSLSAVVTAQDGDGDTDQSAAIDITTAIAFEDDGPTIGSVSANGSVDVDETDAGSPAGFPIEDTSAAAIIAYSGDFGADGPATTGSVSYTLDIVGDGSTALATAQGDHAITLVQEPLTPNVISGVYNDGISDLTAFTVTINADGTVTLVQNVALEHTVDGDNSAGEYNDVLNLAGLVDATVTLTDGDGDSVSQSAGVGAAISFFDDGPDAVDESGATVAEDAVGTIGGNVLSNDTEGADGATVTAITVGVETVAVPQDGSDATLMTANGTYTIDMDGNWTFDPNPGLDHTGGDIDASFSYTLTDGDGDFDTATQPIDITDGAGPIAGPPISLLVDDENLADGTNPAPPVTDSDDIVFTAGSDAIDTIAFGTDLTGLDASLTWVRVDDDTITGSDGGTLVVTLDLTRTGDTATVTATLSNNYGSHPIFTADDTFLLGSVDVVATDIDGDTATSSVSVSVSDDVPTPVVAYSLDVTNGGGASASAYLDTDNDVDDNMGADGGEVIFTDATIAALESQGLTSGLASLEYSISPDGTVLTATKSSDDSVVFTIELQPVGSDDQYVVTMHGSLDSTSTIDFNDGGYDFVGGNGSWAGFTQPGDNDSQDLLLTPVGGDTVNTNANEGGVGGGNSVGSGEAMRVDYVIDLDGSPVPGGDFYAGDDTQTFDGHYTINGGSARFTSINSTTTIKVSAFDDDDSGTVKDVGDGTPDAITSVAISYNGGSSLITTDGAYNVGGSVFTVTFNGDGTVDIAGVRADTVVAAYTDDGYNSVEWAYVSGNTFKIGDFGATAITNDPVDFSVPISVVDGDGDTVDSGELAITAEPTAPPIVLDLDGDGVEFLGMDAGVAYDYGGGLVTTAWVAPDDGLLVHDANGNGAADNGTEIVFGGNGLTDLEGLAAKHDTNRDGVLDAKDADFASFGVWQDTNSNGVTDDGEFSTLTEAGISSIALVSDGDAYTVFDGDVLVHGEGEFTYADGSTGIFADAAFAVSPTAKTSTDPRTAMRPMEMATVAAMASGFFMPEMQAQFDQTFGDPASAHRDMVDFEFAPIADIRAPELPEAEALSFDSLGPTDRAVSSEPAMANILEGQSAFKAPQADLAGSSPDESVNFTQSMDAGPQLAGGPSVFEGFAGGDAASGMEALLMLEAPAKLAEAGEALGEAVADIAAEAAVDAIVDHFAANDGPAVAVAPPEGLLDSMIGNDVALHAMGMMPQDQNDEAAALAAAAA